MIRTRVKVALASIFVVFATMSQAGCFRCAPVFNVIDAPVTTAAAGQLTEEQVRSAIVRAGIALGWKMRDEGPGKLAATIALRAHTAEVEITFSPKQYSIIYKNSTNLDAADGQIHKNYNGWIQNLTRGINAQVSAS